MPSRCIAAGCSNLPKQSSDWELALTLHAFPNKTKFPDIYNAWVNFVKTDRGNWTAPGKDTKLCSKHFVDDDFLNKEQYLHTVRALGLSSRLKLKPQAVPTLPAPKAAENRSKFRQEEAPAAKRRRHKRLEKERHALVEQLLEETVTEKEFENELEERAFEEDAEFLSDDYQESDDDSPSWEPKSSNPPDFYSSQGLITSELNVQDPVNESKFIVGGSNLLELLLNCPKCHATGEQIGVKITRHGVVLKTWLRCSGCCWEWRWQSLGNKPADAITANHLLTASILFTGSQPTKISQFMESNNITFPSKELFFVHQREMHTKVVHKIWAAEQLANVEESKKQGKAQVGGDARNDSMGRSAQFGSYSLIDLDTKKILTVQAVSKVETKMNSYQTELEGLKRSLNKLKDLDLQVNALVTDRHSGVAKYMRESHERIQHYYDVWHLVRSISKKLHDIAKKKDCADELTPQRIRSIVNRLYAIAKDTEPGPTYSATVEEKRLGMLNHLQGIHKHRGHAYFKQCHHRKSKTMPMECDGAAYEQVEKYLSSTAIKKAICKMSPVGQTSRLESYHHVILSFAPKHLCFGYQAMHARLLLAALHYNENCQRNILLDSEGQPITKVTYLKYKGGRGTVRTQREATTRGYVDKLLREVYECCVDKHRVLPELPASPATMTSQLDCEPVEVARAKHRERFSIM